jgi:signal transduction histidine kinase
VHTHARSCTSENEQFATRARLTLDWRAGDHLTVRVCDEGRQPGADLPPVKPPGRHVGHGLVGMRERVAAVGGTLHTGRRLVGGFCVHATVPVPATGMGTSEGDEAV